MREIEFRIRYRDKSWYYGMPLTKIKNNTVAFQSFDGNYYDFFADATTLGQYTGMKDINGTKIFEGDKVKILKDSVCSSSEMGEIGTVCFENGSFMIDFFDKYDDIVENDFLSNFKNEDCEVVGNKYDDF